MSTDSARFTPAILKCVKLLLIVEVLDNNIEVWKRVIRAPPHVLTDLLVAETVAIPG